jgi:hypothetical protein
LPCNQLAIQQALLEANIAEELIRSPEMAEVLRSWLSTRAGFELESRVDDTWYRNHGYGGAHKADAYLRVFGRGLTLTVTTRESVGMQLLDYANTGLTVQEVETFARALAQAAAQERLVQAIAQVARIKSDEPLPNGMRTLQLEI